MNFTNPLSFNVIIDFVLLELFDNISAAFHFIKTNVHNSLENKYIHKEKSGNLSESNSINISQVRHPWTLWVTRNGYE